MNYRSLIFFATAAVMQSQTWTLIIPQTSPSAQPAMARAADGTLHVVAHSSNPANGYWHSRPRVSTPPPAAVPILTDKSPVVKSPTLLAAGGSLLELWYAGNVKAGSTDTASYNGRLRREYNIGAAWFRDPAPHSADSTLLTGGDIISAIKSPTDRWFSSAPVRGVLPGSGTLSEITLFVPERNSTSFHLAVEGGTGKTYEGWYGPPTGTTGLMVRELGPATSPGVVAPGSPAAVGALTPGMRVALSGRLGYPGIFAAYPGGLGDEPIKLWRNDTGTLMDLPSSNGGRQVQIAAGPEGRIWAVWKKDGNFKVALSNRAVTGFGGVATIPATEFTRTWYAIEGSTSTVEIAVNNGTDVFLRGVRMPLEVITEQGYRPLPPGIYAPVFVGFAGEAVVGAIVQVLGQTLQTDKTGTAYVYLKSGNPGTYAVEVTHPDFETTKTAIVVK